MTRKGRTAAGTKRKVAVWLVVLAMMVSLGAGTMAVMADADPVSGDPAAATVTETVSPTEEGTAEEAAGTEEGAAEDQALTDEEAPAATEEAAQETDENSTAGEQEQSGDAVESPAAQPAEEPLLAAPAEEPAKAVEPQEVATVDQRLDGITINLFDYDIGSDQNSGDTWNNNPQANQGGYEGWPMGGINSISNLKFFGQGGAPLLDADSNKYTGEATARQGIVQNKLSEDGYPVMTEDFNSPDRQELSYLFDPNESAPGKTVYSNVGNLFQKNGSGNYTFNSVNSYAYYDPSQGSEGTFKVFEPSYPVYETSYDGSTLSGDPTVNVGYFPFDKYDSTKLDVEPALDIRAPYKPYNHQHGLTMEGKFKMPASLKADGQDIKFHFSGDDDAWLFVDGVLVLDIGGLHRPVGGDVNFTTGEVTVDSVVPLDPWQGDPPATIGASNNIKNIFEAAGETWDPTAEHTYKFFYLERGGCYSNLALETNLWKVSGTSVDVEKVWSDGNENHEDDQVTVQLLANGEEAEGKTLTLSADNDWKDSFVGLPENDAEGNPIEYTVEELYDGYNIGYDSKIEKKSTSYWVPVDPSKIEDGTAYAITQNNWVENSRHEPRMLTVDGNGLKTKEVSIVKKPVKDEEDIEYSQYLEIPPEDNQQFLLSYSTDAAGNKICHLMNNNNYLTLRGWVKGGHWEYWYSPWNNKWVDEREYFAEMSTQVGWQDPNSYTHDLQFVPSVNDKGEKVLKIHSPFIWGGNPTHEDIALYLQNGTVPKGGPFDWAGQFIFWKKIEVEEEAKVPNSFVITNSPKGNGDLEITKTLPVYETSGEKATFVYQVHAELNGKVVYDDIITLDFDKAGTKTAKIEGKIPIDAVVTVKEIYGGAAYSVQGDDTVNATVLSNDDESAPATAAFENTYNSKELTSGYGVLNTYTMGSDARWIVNGEPQGEQPEDKN